MRLKRAILAGIVATTAFGGASAYAQDSSREYWVNSTWNGSARAEAAWQRSLSQAQPPAETVPVGFTITSYEGASVVGQLELGRVSLGTGWGNNDLISFVYPGLTESSVDEAVGEASISWNITPRVAFSTSFSRDIAELVSPEGVPVFEDTIAGGVTYAVTPRFEVSARGSVSVSNDETAIDPTGFSSDEAELGAAYTFMPYFTGSVNYTYRSYDGQEGELLHDESTLSLSLTGKF